MTLKEFKEQVNTLSEEFNECEVYLTDEDFNLMELNGIEADDEVGENGQPRIIIY